MNKLIVFKTISFPTFSETFIVSNIKEAIDDGFKINIIVNNLNNKNNTSQPCILKKYELLEEASKLNEPIGKLNRCISALKLLKNPLLLFFFIKYCFLKKNKSLHNLFTLNFYLKYRNAFVFHVHFATAIHPLFELKEIGFLKSNIIVTFHGYDEHELQRGERLNKTILNFKKYVEHTTANTEYLKNKLVLKGFNSNKIKVIPIGIDTNYFKNNLKISANNECFNIITVGRFIELKGQSYGIKAIKNLIDKGYKITYTIVGYGEELTSLRKLVKDLSLEGVVIFKGSTNQNKVKALLEKNQLFLMTSTSDKSGRCEAFGVVSLEAQAMGVPVIGFKSGGFPETLIEGETGFTVEDKNFIAMANKIEDLINNKQLLNKMKSTAINHIKTNFNTKNVIRKYLELYT
jgi:colanic acid/amylovoran biosynthesis glycosyltransferase